MNEIIKKQLEIIDKQFKELLSIYHTAAKSSSVSDNEFWVWYALLILDGEFSQQDICDLWSFPKQTVNTIISNLSKKGYLYLEIVPGTKNRKAIKLTETGKTYGKKIVSKLYQAELNAFNDLTESEKESFMFVLAKFIHLIRNELNQ